MPNRLRIVLAALLVLPALAIACSGGESSDEDFVAELCEASTKLSTDLGAAVKQASAETDPSKSVEALIPPLDAFLKAFNDASPPKDLKEWHDDASAQIEAAIAKFKAEKTLASLEGFGDSPVPDPPAEEKQRLRDAAGEVDGCTGVAFLKPG